MSCEPAILCAPENIAVDTSWRSRCPAKPPLGVPTEPECLRLSRLEWLGCMGIEAIPAHRRIQGDRTLCRNADLKTQCTVRMKSEPRLSFGTGQWPRLIQSSLQCRRGWPLLDPLRFLGVAGP